jgi:hypothetical protein
MEADRKVVEKLWDEAGPGGGSDALTALLAARGEHTPLHAADHSQGSHALPTHTRKQGAAGQQPGAPVVWQAQPAVQTCPPTASPHRFTATLSPHLLRGSTLALMFFRIWRSAWLRRARNWRSSSMGTAPLITLCNSGRCRGGRASVRVCFGAVYGVLGCSCARKRASGGERGRMEEREREDEVLAASECASGRQ